MTHARPSVVVITLLLHAGLLAALAKGLSGIADKPVTRPPLTVALVPAPQPAPEVKPPAPPRAAAAVKPTPEKKPPRQKPAPAPKPAPEPPIITPPRPAATESAAPAASPSPAISAPPIASAPPPPVKTGVSISASYAASNRSPRQPPISRRLGEQGTVLLRVLVKADGTAGAVDVKSSSGFPLLDEAAKSAVETWRFNPATTDGKPVAEWHLVPIVFTLKD
ncbi:MAG: energy transducer TonB [Pseudomonadota bacterium]